MKSIIATLVLAAAALTVSSAQAGYGFGYGHQGHYNNHYVPAYQPVIVKKVIVPVVPVYPTYNYKICH